jgi:hypothetical protein
MLCPSTFAQTNNNPLGQAGVDIDADHVLRVRQVDPRLRQTQLELARKSHNKVNVAPLRKVSLNRYEQAVANAVGKGGLDDMMISVAGITRIEYLMYLPGSKDIVIAGPAEEIIRDANGYTVGLKSGRPTLRLDDLIVALRAYGPNSSSKVDYISCSIDPTQEGLRNMQQYLSQLGGQVPSNSTVGGIANTMKNALGYQTVTIHGVPTNTRFAQTLVEADYRMKLIGIGLEQPAIRMKSWLDRVSGNSGSQNSLQRWWFEPDYSSVKVSPDGFVLKLEGQGVKLVGEQEHVDRSGNRNASGKAGDAASRGFTKDFTQKYEELADTTPVYHALRNLFDLTVVTAYIRQADMYSESGWDLGVFANEEKLPVQFVESPEQVETAVNAVWKGDRLLTPIGGGVMIDSRKLLKKDALAASDELTKAQAEASAPADLKDGQWWWD